ncbi:phage minor head protein [Nitrosomonas sp. Nm166]|uniref:phage head morphogenesis protein n=1 Tax=Nitrosomonas sp. Nm166 TaxID=1881054 RepID=UPI0008ECA3ED|nr:phage minor head protein [Nitrosomonas sp. Nm166]SFF13506.1 Phage Mu protein F like protein [Nitrosomonas sp. Nm166]
MIKFQALPPKEAIEFFRSKGYKIGFSWEDVWQSEHQAAFTVAKVMQLDILRDIRAGIDSALADGTTFETFRKQLKPLLMQKGWWGKAEMTDPLTGETRLVQLGSTRRLRTIFDTNLRTAHSEGQWERIQDAKKRFPYLRYDANNSEHPRMQHSAWDNLVLPADDPFWQAHFPVKAWGCKCNVTQFNQRMLDQRGLKVGESPEVPQYTYANKRTGEIQKIPLGVDPGFNYPPGGRLDNLPRFVTDKIIQAPADLAATWWQTMLPLQAPGITKTFQEFVAKTFADATPRGKFVVAGFAHPDDIEFLRGQDKTPVSAEIAVQDRLMVGRKADRHELDGDALSEAEWMELPVKLSDPKAVLYDNETGNLLYIMDSQDDTRAQKLVVQMDFVPKKPKRKLNMARTAFKVDSVALKGRKYTLVRGAVE